MSFLIPTAKSLAPQPVPTSPVVDPNAQAKRDAAEQAALAEQKGNGRRATYAAGEKRALDSRQELQARQVLG